MKALTTVFFGLFFAFLQTAQAHADLRPANGAESAANFAEIILQNDRVSIELEIDFSDLPTFVAPAAPGTDPAAGLSRRIGHTLLVSADGVRLSPEITGVEIRPRLQRRAVSQSTNRVNRPEKRSGQVVYAHLQYRFKGNPKVITLTPPLESDGTPMATLGFQATHSGVPITDYRYLSREETLRPDWDDPWYSVFDNPNLTRHHKSATMSFLDVGPREIRHEIIFRLRDLERWTDLNLADMTVLDAASLEDLKDEITDLFARSNPLTADGEKLVPNRAKIERLSVGAAGLNVLEDTKVAERKIALLGIVLFYPVSSLPDKVEMEWTLFTDDAAQVPVRISDPKGGVPAQVSPDDPKAVWKNYIVAWEDPKTMPVAVDTAKVLKLPYLTLLLLAFSASAGLVALRGNYRPVMMSVAASACTAAIFLFPTKTDIRIPNMGAPEPQQAELIFSGLLSNMNTAMSEKSSDGIQSALRPFVTTENSQDIEAEMRRGLSVSLPSGAIAQTDKIDQITIEDVSHLNSGSQILGSWHAQVSGGHWGHQHRRIIEYRAMVDVVEESGHWKINGLTILHAGAPSQEADIEVKS